MKIIEEKNNKDPQGNWTEYEPRCSNNSAKTTITRLRRHAAKDKSIMQDMIYRIRTINAYPF